MTANLVDTLLTTQSVCEAEACAALVLAPFEVWQYAQSRKWQPTINEPAKNFWQVVSEVTIPQDIDQGVKIAYETAQSTKFAWLLYAPMQPGEIASEVGREKIDACRALEAASIGINYVQHHRLVSKSFSGRESGVFDD